MKEKELGLSGTWVFLHYVEDPLFLPPCAPATELPSPALGHVLCASVRLSDCSYLMWCWEMMAVAESLFSHDEKQF